MVHEWKEKFTNLLQRLNFHNKKGTVSYILQEYDNDFKYFLQGTDKDINLLLMSNFISNNSAKDNRYFSERHQITIKILFHYYKMNDILNIHELDKITYSILTS